VSEKDHLQVMFDAWQHRRSPALLAGVLEAANPIIQKAMTTLGNKSPIMRSHARALLLKALPKYDPNRGVPLKNWIFSQLRPLIRLNAQSNTTIPVPERIRRQLAAVYAAEKRLQEDLGRAPNELELADDLKLSPKRIRHIRDFSIAQQPESSFVDDEGAESLPGTSGVSKNKLLMDYVYHDLDPLNRSIVDMSMDRVPKIEIANRLNLSPSSITQRSSNIADKLEALSMNKTAKLGDTHEYSTVQFKIPEPRASEIVSWGRKNILDDDLYHITGQAGYGREDEIHLTLKCGLYTSNAEDVRKAIQYFGPLEVKFGRVTKFRPKGKPYDVIKLDVRGSRLMSLNTVLSTKLRHKPDENLYRPHITLAYVKRGKCDKIVGKNPFGNKLQRIYHVEFVTQSGTRHDISLVDYAETT